MAVSDCTRTCRHCGAQFVRTESGQPTAYCNAGCKQQAYLVKFGPRKRTPHRPKQVWCASCHKPSMRRIRGGKSDAGRFCSRQCAFDNIAHMARERDGLKRIAANWARPPSLPPHIQVEVDALRRIARYVYQPRLTYLPCSGGCGSIIHGYMKFRRCCPSCKQERRTEAGRKARKTEAGRRARRIHKARRRAVERGLDADRIDPIKVFERDGWRCHLCGCDTPKHLRGTYQPNAPELDHVIPLAANGLHVLENVACSCRQCNCKKGATILDRDQALVMAGHRRGGPSPVQKRLFS